jgi:hypothetical protein
MDVWWSVCDSHRFITDNDYFWFWDTYSVDHFVRKLTYTCAHCLTYGPCFVRKEKKWGGGFARKIWSLQEKQEGGSVLHITNALRGRIFPTCFRSSIQNDIYQMSYWYNSFSWWWARGCPKHVENRNKHTRKRTVRQVGYWLGLYRDARSTEHKKEGRYVHVHAKELCVRLVIYKEVRKFRFK